MFEELTDKIRPLVVPFIKESRFELVELNFKRRGRLIVIDITVDKADGGITIEECALINKNIVWKIEEKQAIVENYIIEVSSPGLDRPLRTEKDFLRVFGREVRFHLLDYINGKKEHSGIVKDIIGGEVIVDTKSGDILIPVNKIEKAVQVIR